MPTKITVIHTDDFIRLTPSGRVDVGASRKILTDLVSALRISGDDLALIDMRNASPVLSKVQLLELGIAAGTQSSLLRGKIAILAAVDQETDTEFLEAVARQQGANVRAFTDFETAIEWLAMRQQGLSR